MEKLELSFPQPLMSLIVLAFEINVLYSIHKTLAQVQDAEEFELIVNSKKQDKKMFLFLLQRISELISGGKKATKRQIYYENVTLFKTQQRLDNALEEIAQCLGCKRNELMIVAAGKGLVYGNCCISLTNGIVLDCITVPQLISHSRSHMMKTSSQLLELGMYLLWKRKPCSSCLYKKCTIHAFRTQ
jgi:DNA topoisomerase VI subunit A